MRLRPQPRLLASLFGRLAALASALIFLAGYLATWQHLATVVHVACAEHEVVEDLPQHAAGAERTHGVALTAAPTSGAHHACSIPPSLRSGAPGIARAPTEAEVPRPLPADLQLPRAQDGPTGVAILRLAPKASPPSA